MFWRLITFHIVQAIASLASDHGIDNVIDTRLGDKSTLSVYAANSPASRERGAWDPLFDLQGTYSRYSLAEASQCINHEDSFAIVPSHSGTCSACFSILVAK
jgi:hypothetical protein